MKPRFWQTWDSTAWLAVVTAVGVAVAAIGGIFAYQQWRNDKVLSLQERWGSGDMQARRSRLTDAFVCKGIPNLMHDPTEQRIKEVFLDAVLPSKGHDGIDYDGIDSDVPAYLDFFDDVRTCVDTGVCNPEVACKRFAPEAQWLNRVLGPFMERQRILFHQSDYGQNLERLALSCSGYVENQGVRPSYLSNPAERQIAKGIESELKPETKGFAHYQQAAACRRMRPPVERTISE